MISCVAARMNGFSLEEKLAAKPTDEGPRKRQNGLAIIFSALCAVPSSVSRYATATFPSKGKAVSITVEDSNF